MTQSVRSVGLSGEIDSACTKDFDALLRSLDGADTVVLDFSRVTFFDSSAISCLIRLRKRMLDGGGKGTIRIARPTQTVRQLMELTNLDRVFVLDPPGADDAPETPERVHHFGSGPMTDAAPDV